MPDARALMRAWRVISTKREHAVRRRMRREPMNVQGVVNEVHDDGAAWLHELCDDYGGDFDGLLAVADACDRITGANLLTLAQVGAINVRELVHAATAAGFASGYFVRAELDRARATREAA